MAEDSNVSSLLSTLLNGGYEAPGSGMQALAGGGPMTGATVLARLKGAGNGALGKLGGVGGSAVPHDINGSKLGAVASGFANGMKDAADARAAQQKQAIELMKMQWDHNFKLAELKQKIDNGNATSAETKRYHDILDKYYTGQNAKSSKEDDPSSPANIAKIEQARRQRATTEGLFDKALLNHASGSPSMAGEYPTPEQVKEAKEELARRRQAFNDWDAKQSWNKDGKSGGIPKAGTDDTTGDPPADPNADPAADVPTPPARPPMFKVSPLESAGPAAPATDGPAIEPAAPRNVTGPDGKAYTWTPDGGLVPREGVGTPANPVPDDSLPAFGQ